MERYKNYEIEARREFGLATIRQLGEVAANLARMEDIGVRRKPDGSKVTHIDEELNERFITQFGDAFPSDLVWGEEGANSLQDRALSGAKWTWVVDPIDSTSNLVKSYERVQRGEWQDFSECRSTILLSGFAPGETVPSLSFIHSPFLDGKPTLCAAKDQAWIEDAAGIRRLQPSGQRGLNNVQRFDCVSWRESRPNFRDALELQLPGRRVDRRLSMGAVALGSVDLSVFPGPRAAPYDVTAGAHIGFAAGAAVRTLAGQNYHEVDWLHGPINGVVVAASAELAEGVVRKYQALQAA